MNPEAPSPTPPEDTPINATEPSPLKQIRTYQGDIAEAIQNEHQSLVSIRAAEKARQDLLTKHPDTAKPADPEASARTRKLIVSMSLLLGGLILLGGAGVGGYLAYGKYKEKTAVPAPEIPANRFLPVTRTQKADATVLTRDALIGLLTSERNKPLPAGSLEHIELVQGSSTAPLTTPTEFMLLIDAKPSASFVRALDPLFMLGVIGLPAQPMPVAAAPSATSTPATSTSNTLAASSTPATPLVATSKPEPNATFLLMKLDSYDYAYAGMLGWERNLAQDLLPLFHSADVIATIPANANWSDETIKNKDARRLTDISGKTELIYSFYNQNLLIITANEDALRSILNALDTQALAR